MSKQLPPELRPNLPPLERTSVLQRIRDHVDELMASPECRPFLFVSHDEGDSTMVLSVQRSAYEAAVLAAAAVYQLRMVAEQTRDARWLAVASMMMEMLVDRIDIIAGGITSHKPTPRQ